MANILVTGGNGFIGQHLIRRLLQDGHSIRAMSHGNLELYFINKDEIEWWEADLKNTNDLEGICKNIDIVYHLAAIPRNDLSKSWDDFKAVNISGTKSLLEEAKGSKIKRFVYISTVEAAGYGDGIHARTEEDKSNPDNNYGKSKLEAEQVIFQNCGDIEYAIMRLPMVYGPGTFLIVPKLFGMVRRGIYPFIGNGETKMEFCYVGNIIEALVLAGTKKDANGQLFYVSDERSYTIKEVISNISKAMNKKVFYIHVPVSVAYLIGFLWEIVAKIFPFPPIISPISKKAFFTRETVMWTTKNVNIVNTEKIRSLLGYSPPFSIVDGCKHTADWLIKQLWSKS